MKVKDLIRKLKKFDGELDVFVQIPNGVGTISDPDKVEKSTFGFFGKEIPCVIIDRDKSGFRPSNFKNL